MAQPPVYSTSMLRRRERRPAPRDPAPGGGPDPGTFTQIVSAGDATGDGQADFFVTVGDALWVLTGYNGATVDRATRLSAASWANRDVVTVQDITGDGVTDLLYRTDETGRLLLRGGIKAASGGVDFASLATAGGSAGGGDTQYGASGWSSGAVPFILGTPDANGDSVPDIWAVQAGGSVRFHAGSRSALSGNGTEVVGAATWWKTRQAVG
ncbi:FG-GAP repeat domain-containing protein [Streptomyces sp. NPDC004749]